MTVDVNLWFERYSSKNKPCTVDVCLSNLSRGKGGVSSKSQGLEKSYAHCQDLGCRSGSYCRDVRAVRPIPRDQVRGTGHEMKSICPPSRIELYHPL